MKPDGSAEVKSHTTNLKIKRGCPGVEIPDKSLLFLIILCVSVICLLYLVSTLLASGGLGLCCCAESLECFSVSSCPLQLNYHSCSNVPILNAFYWQTVQR